MGGKGSLSNDHLMPPTVLNKILRGLNATKKVLSKAMVRMRFVHKLCPTRKNKYNFEEKIRKRLFELSLSRVR